MEKIRIQLRLLWPAMICLGVMFNACIYNDEGKIKRCEDGFSAEPYLRIENASGDEIEIIVPAFNDTLNIMQGAAERLQMNMNQTELTFNIKTGGDTDTLMCRYDLGVKHNNEEPRLIYTIFHFEEMPPVRYAIGGKRGADLTSPNDISDDLNCPNHSGLIINE